MYKAEIKLDSVNPAGDRLTTFIVTYPRFVHSELMTHRLFSRNSASSRAIPNKKLMDQIVGDPVMPVYWGKNQAGMQATQEVEEIDEVEGLWLDARNSMVRFSKKLAEKGVHKQLCNRLLEPWMFITVIITATEYKNFFRLRCSPSAQPEIRKIAEMMQEQYNNSVPVKHNHGQWHIPFLYSSESSTLTTDEQLKVSVARCARVSYLTHDGRHDVFADFKLHDRLAESGHWSCFEHQGRALAPAYQSGNFQGWLQYRKLFEGENGCNPLV